MRSVWTALVLIAAVAVFGVAGYVIVQKDPVPSAGQILGVPTPVPGTSTSPAASTSSSGQPAARPVVAFLGDGYTTGLGASAPSGRFSTIVAAALGATEANFGTPGAGYVTAASDGDYGSRIAQLVAAAPDVVVVSGGRNDVDVDLGSFAANAGQLFAQLHALLPHALIVAVAPFWGDSPARLEIAPMAAAIKKAVRAAGGTYLAIPDPLLGHPEWMADDADPNSLGYAAIAAALVARLRPLMSRLTATTSASVSP